MTEPQRLDISLIFLTLVASIAILIGICIFSLRDSFILKIRYDNYATFIENFMAIHFVIILIISILIFIITVTGALSICTSNYPSLVVHAYLFLCMSILMFGYGIFASVQSHSYDGENGILQRTLIGFENTLKTPEWYSFNRTVLNRIQREFKCCGIYNWKDYWRPLTRSVWHGDLLPLPKTCCDNQTIACMPIVKDKRQDGCIWKVGLQMSPSFYKYSIFFIVMGASVGIDAAFIFTLAAKAKAHYFFHPYYI